MWLFVVGAAVIVGYIFMVARAAKMNRDPLQQELAFLILEMMEKGAGDDAIALFQPSALRAMTMKMVVDRGDQTTRLAYALSMVRPRLNASDYRRATAIIRDW